MRCVLEAESKVKEQKERRLACRWPFRLHLEIVHLGAVQQVQPQNYPQRVLVEAVKQRAVHLVKL
jgi:hypothetical protein